ncbi:unnamed protein product [Schistocephalus solidus]|uniref:DUF2958 domain-containing protein n=1 Tax=Schistocephalus solidus TaxID=70667 RepID=A0A183T8B5_SCHSO|nr:unnamed protein product [Schistocephalus solidus]
MLPALQKTSTGLVFKLWPYGQSDRLHPSQFWVPDSRSLHGAETDSTYASDHVLDLTCLKVHFSSAPTMPLARRLDVAKIRQPSIAETLNKEFWFTTRAYGEGREFWILGEALYEKDGVELARGHHLTDLDYADNLALIASGFGDLQYLVSRVNEVNTSVCP